MKNVKLPFFFYFSLASGGCCPQILLVKYESIYFCAKVRVWIDLGEKYGTKFGLLIYYIKDVDFSVDNN